MKISKLDFLDLKNQLIFSFTNSYLIPPFVVDYSQTRHGEKPRHLSLKQSSRMLIKPLIKCKRRCLMILATRAFLQSLLLLGQYICRLVLTKCTKLRSRNPHQLCFCCCCCSFKTNSPSLS